MDKEKPAGGLAAADSRETHEEGEGEEVVQQMRRGRVHEEVGTEAENKIACTYLKYRY